MSNSSEKISVDHGNATNGGQPEEREDVRNKLGQLPTRILWWLYERTSSLFPARQGLWQNVTSRETMRREVEKYLLPLPPDLLSQISGVWSTVFPGSGEDREFSRIGSSWGQLRERAISWWMVQRMAAVSSVAALPMLAADGTKFWGLMALLASGGVIAISRVKLGDCMNEILRVGLKGDMVDVIARLARVDPAHSLVAPDREALGRHFLQLWNSFIDEARYGFSLWPVVGLSSIGAMYRSGETFNPFALGVLVEVMGDKLWQRLMRLINRREEPLVDRFRRHDGKTSSLSDALWTHRIHAQRHPELAAGVKRELEVLGNLWSNILLVCLMLPTMCGGKYCHG